MQVISTSGGGCRVRRELFPEAYEEEALTVAAVSLTTRLTNHILRDEWWQFAAQLVLQLVDQLVDDAVQPQQDAFPRRQLLDGAVGCHVEAIDGS